MKFNKKFLSIFFIAILALVLIGCNGEETIFTTDGTDETTETTTIDVDLAALITQIGDEYSDTLDDEDYLVTEDLNLISSVGGLDITWSSNNTDYLENDGTVHRPSHSVGNQTVVLTATISDGTDEESIDFFVTIKALDKTDQERADEVFEVVTAFPNKDKWSSADSSNLDFLTEGKDADDQTYDVVWSSSHPDVISTDGTITQQEDEVDVTMTATIEIGGVEYSEEVVFTVAAFAQGIEVDSIADAIAMGQDAYVEITGVTVIAMYDSGDVFFTDGTDILYIYSPPFDAEVGDVLDITGLIDFYYNAPQLAGSDLRPLKIADSDAEASEAPITTDETVASIIDNTTIPSTDVPHEYKKYEITASVYYNESWGNYSLFLVPTDYDFDQELDGDATQPDGSSIMIYYRSDMDVLKAFHGQEITIEIIMQGYRTDKSVFYANFFGTASDVSITIDDDAEAVQTAIDSLIIPETILEDTTLDLPTELFGATLTWTSSDDTIIDPVTGEVNADALTTQETVTLTVDVSRGDASDTEVFEIAVGELPVSTIEDVLDASNGTMMRAQGIVYHITQEGMFIDDGTGKIFVYMPDGAPDDLVLGDEVDVIAEKGVYLEGPQLAFPDSVEIISSDNEYEQTAIEYVPGTTELVSGQLYTVTATIMLEGQYDTVYFYDGETLLGFLRYKSAEGSEAALQSFEGQTVIVDLVYYRYDDAPVFFFDGDTEDVEVYEMTDQEKIDADKAALDFGGSVYEETTVTLPETGNNGSEISWEITTDAGSNATLDDVTNELTLSAVTEEATVEITATLTLGTLEETKVFTYTLKNLVMVDLGDFEDQTIGDLVSVRGVVYAIIENGFFIEDETGKLFVYNWDAEYDLGDEVELTGEVAEYKDSYQLANSDLPDALSTDNEYEQEPIVYEDGVTVLDAGQTYTVIGTVAIEGDYDNVYIYYNDTDAFEIYYQSPSASIEALEALEGEEVAVNIIYYNDGSVFVYVGGTEGVSEVFTDFSALHAETEGSYDIPQDTEVYIKGVVTADSYDGLFLQDENGVGFFMYRPDETDINVGDEVIYFGELGSYSGARQLGYGAELISVVSTENPLIVNTMTADDIINLDGTDAGKLISFDGLTVNSYDGDHVIFDVVGTTTEQISYRYYSPSWLPDVYEVGDTLPDVEFIFYNFRDGIIQIDMLDIELTDAQAIQLDADDVPETLELTEDMEIPEGDYGSTFTVTDITGDAATYIDYTTTPGTLLVTQPAVGEADATGVITIEVTLGSETPITKTIDVTVVAEVDLSGETTYTETFTDLGYTGGAYEDGSFTGDNGNTWTYTDARGDFDLDGQAIMLKGGGSLEVTVQGGISTFSVDYYDAYSGAAVVELWINGTLIDTSDSFDDDGDGSVYGTFEVTDINIDGEIVIEIVAGDSQTVLDNLTWTTYTPTE
ncbi:MAG: immunoglobulin-like domain-containing protein [Bacillota bacterium]